MRTYLCRKLNTRHRLFLLALCVSFVLFQFDSLLRQSSGGLFLAAASFATTNCESIMLLYNALLGAIIVRSQLGNHLILSDYF